MRLAADRSEIMASIVSGVPPLGVGLVGLVGPAVVAWPNPVGTCTCAKNLSACVSDGRVADVQTCVDSCASPTTATLTVPRL